jgi:hypothetical protein
MRAPRERASFTFASGASRGTTTVTAKSYQAPGESQGLGVVAGRRAHHARVAAGLTERGEAL